MIPQQGAQPQGAEPETCSLKELAARRLGVILKKRAHGQKRVK
jgi:hypothetical protein